MLVTVLVTVLVTMLVTVLGEYAFDLAMRLVDGCRGLNVNSIDRASDASATGGRCCRPGGGYVL